MSVSQYWTKDGFANVGSLDASGTNSVVYAPGEAIDAKRIILVTTVAQTTADATITVAVRDVDNGNSTTIGTFPLESTGSAADDVQWVDLGKPSTTGTEASDGSLVYSSVDPGGVVEVLPGQELALTSDGGGDTGTYQVYLQYQSKGFNPEVLGLEDAEVVFTHA